MDDDAKIVIGNRLLMLRDLATQSADRGQSRRAFFSGPVAAAAVTSSMRDRKRALQEMLIVKASSSLPPVAIPEPKGDPPAWPTKLRRNLALAGDPAGRRKAEEEEPDRWASELAHLIQEAGLPLAAVAEATGNPKGACCGQRKDVAPATCGAGCAIGARLGCSSC